jgi:ubiquinone/menaquinone biosynthesis C-methylase UbiE
MTKTWGADELREMARGYQRISLLLAAAELDVFAVLANGPMNAEQLAAALEADRRGTTYLADALAALGFLEKTDGLYSPAPGTVDALTAEGRDTVLSYVLHSASCARSWAHLADAVEMGSPVNTGAGVRGAEAEHAAYIEAMEVVNRQWAPEVVASLGPPEFDHLLDVGGGPATWSIAFARAVPGGRVTLYDRAEVLPIARKHVEAAGLSDRFTFVPGDFYTDEALPTGPDLAWVSAIVHQNSRQQNRELFRKVHAALVPGGRILVRDCVMDDTHTVPPFGAMFAVHMLVRTEGGGTFSLEELREDLEASGFKDPEQVRSAPDMSSVVRARKG